MGRPFILYYDEIPSHDCIHCRICRTRVAFIEDYFPNVNDLLSGGFFSKVFNVEVPEDERYHQAVDGKTRANTYCVGCGMLLGWKLIAVPKQSMYIREGGYLMRLHKLIYWNDVTLLTFLMGGANEQAPNDQDGGANEQDHDQDVGTDEEDADQDVGWNKEIDTEVCTCLSSDTAEHVFVNLLIDMKGAQAVKFTAA
ncbi:hypothetical protein HAX54_036180 [Datura stramonium]|uniref:Yippee domain-containing protein n=1 Tax=Datura stramonium TaxID=4076 RepID=A0ABS8SG23_DATST|nr:hypothetical protein [Datura stramonium]